jgi:hypothetical protein
VERNPDGRPVASNGEFAKHAVSSGAMSCARCQRSSMSSGPPRSTLIWMEAVLRIIVRPAGHAVSKYSSIAE